MESVINKINKLREQIEYHRKKYHTDDSPEIPDRDYDKMFYELVDLENKNPEYYDENSPTQQIGANILDKFEKVTHLVKMGSLQDVFSYDELHEFIDKIESSEYTLEYKIDGLSVSLVYKDGCFIQGSTRGDGMVGEDVTQNLKTISNVPLTIREKGYLEVRGEVYMPRSVFRSLNDERAEKEEPLFANPRNAAAGSLKQLDPKITASRKLDIFVFNIQLSDNTFSTHDESLKYLCDMGFKTIPYVNTVKTFDEITTQIDYIGSQREDLPFDIDGVVVKVNSLKQREIIGENTNTPKWAVAYKFPPERKETKLLDIVIKVGRTGVLTPNAVLEPIHLAGTVVSRTTLHNIDFINEKDIRIGDFVNIQKAGDIIPIVVDVNVKKRVGSEMKYNIPEVCPSCGEPTIRDEETAVRCTNSACPAQLIRSISHFSSRDAMNINGLGPSIIKLLINDGLISNVADLYKLKVEDIKELNHMLEKSAQNLIDSIQASKKTELERVIYAFGIRQIGKNTASALTQTYNDIEFFFNLTVNELSGIYDIGEVSAQNIVDFFSHPQTRIIVDELKQFGVITTSTPKITDTRFEGKIFVLTGTLPTLTREEAKELIEKKGGKISLSVSKNTTYVLVGKDAGAKLTKAENLGIELISEENLMEMVK